VYAKWLKKSISFGGSNLDLFYDIIEDSDGNYIAVGYTNSNDFGIIDRYEETANEFDGLIVKFDTEGNVIWNITIGEIDIENLFSVIQNNEGNYIAVGSSRVWNINGGGQTKGWIVKIDLNGNIIWSITTDDRPYDVFKSIVETTDGNYIVAGETYNQDTQSLDASVIKFDSLGNIIWDKVFGENESDSFESIIQDSSGVYIAVGYTYTPTPYSDKTAVIDAWMVKLDANGEIIW